MSRSYRRFSVDRICGGESEKDWKRSINRVLRHSVRARLTHSWCDEDLILPILDDVGNEWSSPSDGTKRYRPYDAKAAARMTIFEHYKATRMK